MVSSPGPDFRVYIGVNRREWVCTISTLKSVFCFFALGVIMPVLIGRHLLGQPEVACSRWGGG